MTGATNKTQQKNRCKLGRMKINHIDLFSGIGGFAYAAQQVWGEEYHNILFCDNNKFCQQVIKKNFGKDSVIYGDIRDVTYADWNRLQKQGQEQQASGNRQFSETSANTDPTGFKDRSEERGRQKASQGERKRGFSRCDLLTGGFPCQPFSCAGKRRGTEDNRYLWPEMLRVIRDFKPTWIIAENVRGLLTISGGLVFEQVCLDLEREGYEVQPFIIPAVAVNAPHRRDRVWIIANRKSINEKRGEQNGDSTRESERQIGNRNSNAANTESRQPGEQTESKRWQDFERRSWETSWLEVATELCGMDDGLPAELDGFKLTKAGHRVERLKSLGNAIVPQVAIEIMKAIKEVTNAKHSD